LYPTRVQVSPSPLAVGDFNNDSYQDIAIVNRYESNIGVLLGNGDGTFQEERKFWIQTDDELSLIVIGDLNNDNYLDLVFTNGKNNIGTMLGNSKGNFHEPIMNSIEADDFPTSILMNDFNNDGVTDLVVTLAKEHTTLMLYGNNDGTFETQVIISDINCTNRNLVVGDFNKDGQLDLIGVYENICVLLTNENQGFGPPLVIPVEFSIKATSAVVGDFNHDDQLDFVFTEDVWNNVVILLGNGVGTFQEQKRFSTGIHSGPMSIVAADFNNDGEQDFAVGLTKINAIGVIFGRGDGTFEKPIEFSTGDISEPAFITVGNFNSDTHLDIVVKSKYHATMRILVSVNGCFIDFTRKTDTTIIPKATLIISTTETTTPILVTNPIGEKSSHTFFTQIFS
jgi:hypothetical protein